MTRAPSPGDVRLTFPNAVFLAGSRVPGDDVLVAVTPSDNRVFVFDWSKPVPNRWVPLLSLDAFCAGVLERISECAAQEIR